MILLQISTVALVLFLLINSIVELAKTFRKKTVKAFVVYAAMRFICLFVSPKRRKVIIELSRKIYLINKTVSNINYGGCGHFSLCLHDYLNEKGIENEIIFLSYKRDVPKHVIIKVGKLYIDNNFFYTWLPMYLFSKGDIKSHSRYMLTYLLKRKQWNPKFKLSDTPIIKYILSS